MVSLTCVDYIGIQRSTRHCASILHPARLQDVQHAFKIPTDSLEPYRRPRHNVDPRDLVE